MSSRAIAGIAGRQTQSLRERLELGLHALHVDVSDNQQAQLLEFLALLVKWNEVYNLTSVRDPDDMLAVHLLDALSILPIIDRTGGGTLLDVGSGAGLPAIPIAIVRPLVTVHSIDAVAKKIGFQLQAKAILKLPNLHPLHTRIEAAAFPRPPAVIVSRAFAEVAVMLESIDHIADERTQVIAMKGKEPGEELEALPAGWNVDRIEMLEVPFLGAQRCAVVMTRAHGSVRPR